MHENTINVRSLSLFALVMITVGSVDSLRNLPATALFGSYLIFFFLAAGVMFLIPCALVSAELASTVTEQGGVYGWVKKAFGPQLGFLAIWFQWVENIIWYPTILSFVAGTLGFLISPDLANNKYFLIAVILCAFWGATLVNLYGMKSSVRFSNFCGIMGLLIPMTFIIFLGFAWWQSNQTMQINFTLSSLIPNFADPNDWVSLTGIILSFCGMEIATVYARDVKNPQRTFPLALLYATVIILVTLLLGSLAIAIVVPPSKISLVAGIMQAFEAFLSAYHLGWFLPILAFMLVIGSMGAVSNWVIAPVRGLIIAANDGHLPKLFVKENQYDAPHHILVLQAVIVSLLSMVFLLMPSVNGSYWLLTALAAQLYMLMYFLMFAAGIYLSFKLPAKEGTFRIPGGPWGTTIVSVIGIASSLLTVIVSFIPPDGVDVGGAANYDRLLMAGLLVMVLPPFILYWYRRRFTTTSSDLPVSS